MPRSGRIPRAAERLGPWDVAAGRARPEPVLRGGGGHSSERPAYRKKANIFFSIYLPTGGFGTLVPKVEMEFLC